MNYKAQRVAGGGGVTNPIQVCKCQQTESIDLLKGRAANEGPSQAHQNLMKFNKDKCMCGTD